MRPINSFEGVSLISACFNSGLPLSGTVVYNEWQKLPLSGPVPQNWSGISSTPKAAMKPARSEQTSNNSPALEPSPNGRAVETRAQRLERIKREIQNGTYESEEKLEKAIERMLGVL